MTGDRARLTLLDVVYIAASLAVLAFLAQVFYPILQEQAGELGTGTGLLVQTLVPALVIAILYITFAIATSEVT